MKKRETAMPLFFYLWFASTCSAGILLRGLYMGSLRLLCAFFMVIIKLLKTNRIHKPARKAYKTLIYSIIIVWSLGDLSAVCRRSAYRR